MGLKRWFIKANNLLMRTVNFIFLSLLAVISCQDPYVLPQQKSAEDSDIRIMFWNVENLFDCYDDTLTGDNEYVPGGIRGWNSTRYKLKINNLYKTIVAAGILDPPEMIGVCEIENRKVILDLLTSTPFSGCNYRFIHYDSPDRRGIDVALFYNPARLKVIGEKVIPVVLNSGSLTRDILYVRMNVLPGDTLSVFVNHWPSKYGGAGITEEYRESAARTLVCNISMLQDTLPLEKILIMGDFNDTPESRSIRYLCDSAENIVNLAESYKGVIPGSYKFEGVWEMIDQIFISKSLLYRGTGFSCKNDSYKVFSPGFLQEADEKFGGIKPFRTYNGMIYQGGFSDHFPVTVDLVYSR